MANEVELVKASSIQQSKDAYEAAKEDLAEGLGNLQTSDAQVQSAIAEALTQTDVDSNYISYEVGVKPSTSGATEGTIGAYFASDGLLQKLELDTGAWVDIGKPIATKSYIDNRGVSLRDFGAVGDGVTSDSAAIKLAFENGGKVFGKKGDIYLIDKQINIPANTIFDGLGCTFKRADEIKTTTTSALTTSDTIIPVADASIFEEGDYIFVLDGNTSSDISRRVQIDSISGNNITIDQTINRASSIGATVIKEFALIDAGGNNNVTIKNTTFDGNKSNNTATKYWYAWKSLGSNGKHTRIENCHFKNTPCENIIVSGPAWIVNCSYEDLGGSFVHLGNSQDGSKQFTNIIGCYGTNSNIYSTDDSGHSEAVITFSQGVKYLNVSDCHFENANDSAIAGPMVSDEYSVNDTRVRLRDSVFINASAFFYGLQGDINYSFIHLSVDNCYVEDCFLGYLATGPLDDWNPVTGGRASYYINITNNVFIDTKISFQGVIGVNISDNQFTATKAWTTRLDSYHLDSFVTALGSDINISNNVIVNLETPDNQNTASIRIGNYADTLDPDNANLAWCKNVIVSNNTIKNAITGIAIDNYNYSSAPSYYFRNWYISNNNIHTVDDYNYTRALEVFCGMVANGNNIFMESGRAGIYGVGCSSANSASYPKAIITNNVVDGLSFFVDAIVYGNSANVNNNIVVSNNIVNGSITLEQATDAGNNTVQNNIEY